MVGNMAAGEHGWEHDSWARGFSAAVPVPASSALGTCAPLVCRSSSVFVPVSMTSAARSPSTMPTFGTSGMRPSGMTKTPSAISTELPVTHGPLGTVGSRRGGQVQ